MGKKAIVTIGYNDYVVPVSKLSAMLAVLGELVPLSSKYHEKLYGTSGGLVYWAAESRDKIEINLIDDKRIFEFEPEDGDI